MRDLGGGATPEIRKNYSGGRKGTNAFYLCLESLAGLLSCPANLECIRAINPCMNHCLAQFVRETHFGTWNGKTPRRHLRDFQPRGGKSNLYSTSLNPFIGEGGRVRRSQEQRTGSDGKINRVARKREKKLPLFSSGKEGNKRQAQSQSRLTFRSHSTCPSMTGCTSNKSTNYCIASQVASPRKIFEKYS